MENEILEGNKLIAEFMGWEYAQNVIGNSKSSFIYKDSGGTTYANEEMFKYHSSWDWLMPVVEKIEKDISKEPFYGFTVRIADRCCLIACHQKNKQDGVIYQTPWGFRPLLKIDAVYQAVIEFIKWYNQNKTE
jgi:hypothetical protein